MSIHPGLTFFSVYLHIYVGHLKFLGCTWLTPSHPAYVSISAPILLQSSHGSHSVLQSPSCTSQLFGALSLLVLLAEAKRYLIPTLLAPSLWAAYFRLPIQVQQLQIAWLCQESTPLCAAHQPEANT